MIPECHDSCEEFVNNVATNQLNHSYVEKLAESVLLIDIFICKPSFYSSEGYEGKLCEKVVVDYRCVIKVVTFMYPKFQFPSLYMHKAVIMQKLPAEVKSLEIPPGACLLFEFFSDNSHLHCVVMPAKYCSLDARNTALNNTDTSSFKNLKCIMALLTCNSVTYDIPLNDITLVDKSSYTHPQVAIEKHLMRVAQKKASTRSSLDDPSVLIQLTYREDITNNQGRSLFDSDATCTNTAEIKKTTSYHFLSGDEVSYNNTATENKCLGRFPIPVNCFQDTCSNTMNPILYDSKFSEHLTRDKKLSSLTDIMEKHHFPEDELDTISPKNLFDSGNFPTLECARAFKNAGSTISIDGKFNSKANLSTATDSVLTLSLWSSSDLDSGRLARCSESSVKNHIIRSNENDSTMKASEKMKKFDLGRTSGRSIVIQQNRVESCIRSFMNIHFILKSLSDRLHMKRYPRLYNVCYSREKIQARPSLGEFIPSAGKLKAIIARPNALSYISILKNSYDLSQANLTNVIVNFLKYTIKILIY